MYRQTLAASWAAQTGEFRADEVIEDIFGGGNGWGGGGRRMRRKEDEDGEGEGDESEGEEGDRKTLRGVREGKEGSRRHSRVGSRGERRIVSNPAKPPLLI